MKFHQYQLRDGRTAFSVQDLTYACDGTTNCLNLNKLTRNDEKSLSIIAHQNLASCMRLLLDEKKWETPEYAFEHIKDGQVSYYRHFCIILNDEVYINNGGYVPLDKFLKTATAEETEYALRQIATQAVLAQLAMSQLEAEHKPAEVGVDA